MKTMEGGGSFQQQASLRNTHVCAYTRTVLGNGADKVRILMPDGKVMYAELDRCLNEVVRPLKSFSALDWFKPVHDNNEGVRAEIDLTALKTSQADHANAHRCKVVESFGLFHEISQALIPDHEERERFVQREKARLQQKKFGVAHA